LHAEEIVHKTGDEDINAVPNEDTRERSLSMMDRAKAAAAAAKEAAEAATPSMEQIQEAARVAKEQAAAASAAASEGVTFATCSRPDMFFSLNI